MEEVSQNYLNRMIFDCCENTQFNTSPTEWIWNGLRNKMYIHPANLLNIAIPIPAGLSFRTDDWVNLKFVARLAVGAPQLKVKDGEEIVSDRKYTKLSREWWRWRKKIN